MPPRHDGCAAHHAKIRIRNIVVKTQEMEEDLVASKEENSAAKGRVLFTDDRRSMRQKSSVRRLSILDPNADLRFGNVNKSTLDPNEARGGGTPKSGKTARSLSKKRSAAYKHLMETNVEVEQKALEIPPVEEESFETLALRARAMRGDKAKMYQESQDALKKKETRT